MTDQIDVIMADLDLYTRGEIVALALNVNANLRESPPLGTPIDTGWASANWVPSVGEPVYLQNLKDPTPLDAIERASKSDAGVNDLLGWKPGDGSLFSTNNVPYIRPLNNGHSPQQAQPGFIQRAVEKAIRMTYSAGASRAARFRRAANAKAAKPRRLS
jgi:hypothetical protein